MIENLTLREALFIKRNDFIKWQDDNGIHVELGCVFIRVF